jgi:hypothetical protein
MPVAAEAVRRARQGLAEGIGDASHLQGLETLAELIGFMVATSRAEGRGDDVDSVELLVRAVRFDKQTISEAGRLLAALGYTEVAQRLRELARRAKRTPTWLERSCARQRQRKL